jgi:hypothetical protein
MPPSGPDFLVLADPVHRTIAKRLTHRGRVQILDECTAPTRIPLLTRVLILGDGAKGTAALRTIRARPENVLTPVLIVEDSAGRRTQHDRSFADQVWDPASGLAGLVAAVTALDEVAARVEQLGPMAPSITHKEVREVLLLRYLATRETETLEPRRCPTAIKGYDIPLASLILGVRSGEEFPVLDQMTALDLFRRHFHDRIHTCPHCGHFAINFREVCPSCRSVHLNVVDTIHHYRCGHVAPEADFHQREELVCRKCNRRLRHVGVDYDRPNQVFVCADCETQSPEPEVECLSLQCGRLFSPESARKLDVYSYEITGQGAAVAERGALPAGGLTEMLHETLHTVREDTFEQLVHSARNLADRYQRPYSLVRFSVMEQEELAERDGAKDLLNTLHALVEVLRGILRETDVICPEDEAAFRVLFLETPRQGVEQATARARAAIADRVIPTVPVHTTWLEGRE